MERPRKILLMGDYSNCHRTLATGLRRAGCDVTVASNGSRWMDTERDIDLCRPFAGPAGGLTLWAKLHTTLRPRLAGFDVVAIHNPVFVDLRPSRVSGMFRWLRRHNRRVVLTAMGGDIPFIDLCLDPAGPLRYSEWRLPDRPAPMLAEKTGLVDEWHNPALAKLTDEIYDSVDGIATVLYEYDLAVRRRVGSEKPVGYIGLPVDTVAIRPVTLPDRIDRVKFFLGRHAGRLAEKGTGLLETAARRVVERNPRHAELVIVENKPYDEYLELLRSAHVVLDQVYSYTPALNALLAMAYGLNVVSGGEPDFYDFIGENENRPIINAPYDVEALTSTLQKIVDRRDEIAARGRASRAFVEKHNSTDIVAGRALKFWTGC